MNWKRVFQRWLDERPVIERIEFADVAPSKCNYGFEYVGPVVIITKGSLQ